MQINLAVSQFWKMNARKEPANRLTFCTDVKTLPYLSIKSHR